MFVKEPIDIDLASETSQLIQHCGDFLTQHGLSLSQVFFISVWLPSMPHFLQFNSAYRQFFSSPPPSRTCVQSGKLTLQLSGYTG
mmetsp:Transcript_19854/g.9233  ORF Transcript_19854/g.9233 Transcript_19854/m.9233 type:complete len:85 (-) Transcript_19854:709-963(-)